ncbi:hypothetical protein M8C17_02285 [Micromonospora sp. RHAY321]|uniref:hypothetical protein n=1 Tax=Micromonospora sp. RHAY321 TaxID=2944807 RepID=UPI00207C9E8E|nr:hypothetical protein [Micromonospora sp. RHAY321]MCO1593983.1 hypothetical protein [Micromonospora sp. RHAY321]
MTSIGDIAGCRCAVEVAQQRMGGGMPPAHNFERTSTPLRIFHCGCGPLLPKTRITCPNRRVDGPAFELVVSPVLRT